MRSRSSALALRAPPRRPTTTIRITGVLDLATVADLARRVRERSPHEPVRIDLRHAREIHDVAIVALARELRPLPVALVGLSRHHERVLGYVGREVPEALLATGATT